MTLAARRVFEDACRAHASFAPDSQAHVWRHHWILNVVLLRAVGHVLHNVDGDSSSAMRVAVDSWWARMKESKPEPAIFWKFIEEERNSIVKEYASQGVQKTSIRQVRIELGTGRMTRDPHTVISHTMYAGHYAGRDQHELIAEAIAWWDEQLKHFEGIIGTNLAEA